MPFCPLELAPEVPHFGKQICSQLHAMNVYAVCTLYLLKIT